jgi:transcriptional regulator with XRE-family HTH domain
MNGQLAFRERLQLVVDAIFGGNVTSAAKQLGVSQPTLHKILSGKIHGSKASTVEHLADRLGVSEAWLRGQPDPTLDASDDLPRGAAELRLLERYYARHTQLHASWIEATDGPQTAAGRRILKAYRAWMYRQTRPEWELIRQAAHSGVQAQIQAGKQPEFLPEHLATTRAFLHAEVALLALVRSALRQLDEVPSLRKLGEAPSLRQLGEVPSGKQMLELFADPIGKKGRRSGKTRRKTP